MSTTDVSYDAINNGMPGEPETDASVEESMNSSSPGIGLMIASTKLLARSRQISRNRR